MLVSIYLPTKNRLDSLKCAVNSALNQTYQDIELIIVDDNSVDNTPVYLDELIKTDPRVKIIKNKTTLGACYSRNAAIRSSKGKFLTGLDDDDEFKLNRIEALVDYWGFLSKYTSKSFSCIYTNSIVMRDRVEMEEIVRPLHVEYYDLFKNNVIGNQVFAPRERFIDVGLYDEQMPAWQDMEFFYRILRGYGSARLCDIASYVFDDSPRIDRISIGKKEKILTACYKMTEKHAKNNPRAAQQLLLQAYSDYYGFSLTISDFINFSKFGFWRQGCYLMANKVYKSYVSRLMGRS